MKKIDKEPVVEVGIVWGAKVAFSLHGRYRLTAFYPDGNDDAMCEDSATVGTSCLCTGNHVATADNDLLRWDDGRQRSSDRQHGSGATYRALLFEPTDVDACTFELHAVTIGIGFHWERREDQRFRGSLRLLADGRGQVVAVNLIPVENYLLSVIASEMSAHASLELLRAHAVISRSWLLAQMGAQQIETRQEASDLLRNKQISSRQTTLPAEEKGDIELGTDAGTPEIVRWYDHQAHTLFHVCADDHCQRYQGLARSITPQAREAVLSTRGQVLTYEGRICDARFSKCCGGVLEEFPTCWEDVDHPYLRRRRDLAGRRAMSAQAAGTRVDEVGTAGRETDAVGREADTSLPDLTCEAEADRWIRSAPEAFCHTGDPRILRQVLNDYDQETHDFYRWTVDYTQGQLKELIGKRLGVDLGDIIDLIPLSRGSSGRIYRLKIVGSQGSLVVGKELEIRRALSATHLYSSAFVVGRWAEDDSGAEHGTSTVHFRLIGAGWGHGVGLCQIGAAVMGEQGYAYRDILQHYYAGAEIEEVYE